MKTFFCWLLMATVSCIAFAQETISKSYPITAGQTVNFDFDFPKTIRVSNWDKKEIAVVATVKVDGVAAADVFSLIESESKDQISIKNKLEMAKIPQRFYAVTNGVKSIFNTKEEMNAFLREKGSTVTANYQSRNIEISIEIKLPANTKTNLSSTYGIVELVDFEGPIKIDATYGGIDAKLQEKAIGSLKMTNRFGKIYTDFNFKPEEIKEQRFFTSINANPGKGATYDFSSSYGHIYLRKP
ncbi:hypothetical protein [Pedobacter sp. Leaf41]|uniref:hypothetical protein n=1 Tax=Pedobacter sp. Leaf41 TaxID=1736218 RepID=UPI000A8C2BB8|nr:hypothetical protein [Pedobacter sp. Leaf41]